MITAKEGEELFTMALRVASGGPALTEAEEARFTELEAKLKEMETENAIPDENPDRIDVV